MGKGGGRIKEILTERWKALGGSERSLKYLPSFLQGGSSYVISLVGVVLMGRLFPLAEIGIWSLCLVFGTIASGVVTFGFDRLLAREKDPARVVAMAAISVRNAAISVGLGFCVLGVLHYSGWQLPAYFLGGLLLALTSGLMQIGQQWNLRFDELGVLQGGRIVIASIFLLIMLGAAGLDWRNANALVAASALSMFVGAGFSYFRSHNKRRDFAVADGLPGIWRDEFRSAMVITFSGLINRINLSLPVMICAMMGDIVLNGEVALAQRVVNVPIAILAYTAGTMYLSTLLRVLHEDPAGLRREYMKSAKKLVVISGALLLPVMLCSPLISILFLGSTSSSMAFAIVMLSVLGIIQSTQGNLSPMLNYLGQEKMQLHYEIAMGVCFGLIAGLGTYYFVGSLRIFGAIIITQCLGYFFHFRLTLAAIK